MIKVMRLVGKIIRYLAGPHDSPGHLQYTHKQTHSQENIQSANRGQIVIILIIAQSDINALK